MPGPTLIEVEKSPNWDEAIKEKENLILHGGQFISGFPFNEGFPKNKNKACLIVWRDGKMDVARVDTSNSELAWKKQYTGFKIEERVVAGWLQIIGPRV
jgi:hypothetical protein